MSTEPPLVLTTPGTVGRYRRVRRGHPQQLQHVVRPFDGRDLARVVAHAHVLGQAVAAAILLCGYEAALVAGVMQERPVHIIVVGDFLAAGYGLQPAQAFPSIVKRLADEAGWNTEVLIAARGGNTSADALAALGEVLWLHPQVTA